MSRSLRLPCGYNPLEGEVMAGNFCLFGCFFESRAVQDAHFHGDQTSCVPGNVVD